MSFCKFCGRPLQTEEVEVGLGYAKRLVTRDLECYCPQYRTYRNEGKQLVLRVKLANGGVVSDYGFYKKEDYDSVSHLIREWTGLKRKKVMVVLGEDISEKVKLIHRIFYTLLHNDLRLNPIICNVYDFQPSYDKIFVTDSVGMIGIENLTENREHFILRMIAKRILIISSGVLQSQKDFEDFACTLPTVGYQFLAALKGAYYVAI